MQTTSNNLKFKQKVYCDYYMKKLVEEIVLQPNPADVHYGKCAIIGETIYDTLKQCFYLKNLQLIGLDKTRYNSKDGQFKMLLFTSSSVKPIKQSDRYVEVYGEAGFVLKNDKISDNSKSMASCRPSNEFILELRKLQLNLEHELGLEKRLPTGLLDPKLNENIRKKLIDKLNEFRQSYEPAFIVHYFFLTPRARELIRTNLLCRTVCGRLDMRRKNS